MNDTPRKTLSITRKRSGAKKRIIRRDELPNVQPAGKGKPKPPAKAKKPPRKPRPKPRTSPPPSQIRMQELNDRLNAYPVWRDHQPLMIGIDKELFRLINDEHFSSSKRVVRMLLAKHCRHRQYLQALSQGGDRHHLDGTPTGTVTADERQQAAETLTKRQQMKA